MTGFCISAANSNAKSIISGLSIFIDPNRALSYFTIYFSSNEGDDSLAMARVISTSRHVGNHHNFNMIKRSDLKHTNEHTELHECKKIFDAHAHFEFNGEFTPGVLKDFLKNILPQAWKKSPDSADYPLIIQYGANPEDPALPTPYLSDEERKFFTQQYQEAYKQSLQQDQLFLNNISSGFLSGIYNSMLLRLVKSIIHTLKIDPAMEAMITSVTYNALLEGIIIATGGNCTPPVNFLYNMVFQSMLIHLSNVVDHQILESLALSMHPQLLSSTSSLTRTVATMSGSFIGDVLAQKTISSVISFFSSPNEKSSHDGADMKNVRVLSNQK